jgi:outer membrane murein-binding lipoprotein Lpp
MPDRRRFAAVLAVLVLAACSRDQEINAVLDDVDAFTTEVVQAVQSSPDPAAGVDRAQKLLAEKGPDIRRKMASIKDVRGFQASDATKKRLASSLTSNVTKVMGLQMTHMGRMVSSPAFKAKLEKLGNDYNALLLGK